MTGVEIIAIPNGRFAENCYLLHHSGSKAAVVIDPGEEHRQILAVAAEHQLEIAEIWLSHAHIDHIWGSDAVRDATGARVMLHRDALRWYDAIQEQARFFGIEGVKPLAPPDRLLDHGDELSLGPATFEVRSTPGHAPGHVIIVGEGICFSGDLVFQGSVGRTDIAGCDQAALERSIRDEFLTLPDDTRVLSGHGGETTVGRERRHNPFFPAPDSVGMGNHSATRHDD